MPPIGRDTCTPDGKAAVCAGACLRFPDCDALLFCAAPDRNGVLALQLVLTVTAEGAVAAWRPDGPEGAATEAVRSVRAFLARLDGLPFLVPEAPLRCERPDGGYTLSLERLPGDLVLGSAVRRGGGDSGGSGAGDGAGGSEGGSEGDSTELPSVGDLLADADRLRGLLVGLPTHSRRLVQGLAVLGGHVAVPRLGTLVGNGPDALPEALQTALDAGLLHWHARSGSAEVPERLRGLVRADMSVAERRDAHAWAERWSQGADALLHRAAAAQSPSPGLADALEREADGLAAEGHSSQAADLLRYAAGLSADPATASRRLLAAVDHELRLHRCGAAKAALRTLRRHPPSAHERALAGRLSVLEGDVRTGLALLTEAYDQLTADASEVGGSAERAGASGAAGPDTGPPAGVVQASTLWLAEARWLAGFPAAEIRPLIDASRVPTSHDPYWRGMREWLDTIVAAADKGPSEALDTVRSATPTHPRAAAARRKALLVEAWLHLEAGDLDRCESAVHRALDMSALGEAAAADGLPLVLLGHLHWMRGDWAQAKLHATMVLNAATPLWRPLGGSLGLLVAASRGRQADSAADGKAGATVPAGASTGGYGEGYAAGAGVQPCAEWEAQADGQPALCAWAGLFARLVGAVEAADAPRAVAVLGANSARSGPGVLPSALMPWRELELLRAAVLVGDSGLIRRSLHSIRRLHRRSGSAWSRMFASWGEALAAAHAGRRETALGHYADAERHAAEAGAGTPWYRARLQADHADVLAAIGKRRGALDRYRAAQETAAELGAQPLLDRCVAGLSRLRLPRSTTGYGLTRRETDVVELVASGLTNKETAGRLFVTPASIAFHLSNIYAKTGVSNRYELRSWWHSLSDA
ncbi:LuxR C-terminal-related transcriptional regulator [Streptomyces sp. NPDC006678]|uniref:LuxR C-terminal-related transcriptional regulator n=1 Tax=Streptomyces sp. NPDC006678 TaxID=3157185 RepID=UPI0033D8AF95